MAAVCRRGTRGTGHQARRYRVPQGLCERLRAGVGTCRRANHARNRSVRCDHCVSMPHPTMHRQKLPRPLPSPNASPPCHSTPRKTWSERTQHYQSNQGKTTSPQTKHRPFVSANCTLVFCQIFQHKIGVCTRSEDRLRHCPLPRSLGWLPDVPFAVRHRQTAEVVKWTTRCPKRGRPRPHHAEAVPESDLFQHEDLTRSSTLASIGCLQPPCENGHHSDACTDQEAGGRALGSGHDHSSGAASLRQQLPWTFWVPGST
mmetsp:Transcript_50294/g.109324  ORF Transcript_50294/g.109324 Transcript_50294/m.109324 type:complete len:259 (-) Transcript_50294:85-861(-)